MTEPRNPNGRNGKPRRIPLPFEDALKASTEVKPFCPGAQEETRPEALPCLVLGRRG